MAAMVVAHYLSSQDRPFSIERSFYELVRPLRLTICISLLGANKVNSAANSSSQRYLLEECDLTGLTCYACSCG